MAVLESDNGLVAILVLCIGLLEFLRRYSRTYCIPRRMPSNCFSNLCEVSEAHPEVRTIQSSLLLAAVSAAHVSYFLFKVSRVVVRGFFQVNVPFYNVP